MAPQRKRATNGYIYEKQPDGKWKQVDATTGYSPSEQYDAANQGAFEGSGDLDGYIGEIMNASGMGGGDVSAPSSGNQSGSGKSSGSGETGDGSADAEGTVQQGLDDGIGLEEIAAGALGAAAGAIATRMLTARKNPKPSAPSGASVKSTGPANPATDTPGEADKGGTGKNVVPVGSAAASGEPDMPRITDDSGIIDAAYDDISGQYRLPPGAVDEGVEELPAFNDVIKAYQDGKSQMSQGSQPAAQVQNPQLALPEPRDPDAQAWVDDIARRVSGGADPVGDSIQAVEGPNAPLVDPEMEASLQAYAQQMREQGNFSPTMDPSKNPDMPAMDPYIMQRLKAILASM